MFLSAASGRSCKKWECDVSMSVVIPVARGLNTNDFPGKLNSWFRSLSPTGLKPHCAALANCFNLLNLLNTRLPQISTVLLNALWLRRQVQQLQPLVRPLKNGKNCSEGTLQLQRMPKGSHTHTRNCWSLHEQMPEENCQIQNANLYVCKLHVHKEAEDQTHLLVCYTRAP